jgi:superfamily II DNA or RNA helicase
MSKREDIDRFFDPPIPEAPEKIKQPIRQHVISRADEPLRAVVPALKEYPKDPELLLLAAIAALMEERPDQSLVYQKRYEKHFVPHPGLYFLQAIATAQKGYWSQAARILNRHKLNSDYRVASYLPCGWQLQSWIRSWITRINREVKQQEAAQKKAQQMKSKSKAALAKAAAPKSETSAPVLAPVEDHSPELPLLPRLSARIDTSLVLPDKQALTMADDEDELVWFRLRSELARLSLFQGFDELLCLPLLHNINTYWYQVETVRKVLKQFRGRVLLSDEVGLGKTIEAGMALKEYMLRGMVKKVLALTPASMVGQWREEMQTKFDIDFASSYDPLLRSDPRSFWAQPRVIASIATARRSEHLDILRNQVYDLVIVDEAHHLKNRATSNYKLVDALQKRFLLLLSATPVQNSLVELYNLLTLLKPGIFKTEKEFRSTYMTAGKPRVPANRDVMRDLMRDVMIRNTRSQVDVRLPSRHATMMRLDPGAEEAACYSRLSEMVHRIHLSDPSRHRLSLRHLLSAAGSSPAAAAAAIHRFRGGDGWNDLYDRYRGIEMGCKERALIELLHRNPDEKKMVFAHHRETLARLDHLLRGEGMTFARFDGSMSGPEKDAAVERFRDEAPLLLCTESGGEGRNLQFCNTLINFDLPWNPMSIEQRIGRLHRIGQTREVFVFNLVARHTLEEYVLRVLDEKINMFELVVGEIDAILGEMEDEQEFAEMVFSTWVETTEQERAGAFEELGERMVKARRQYEEVKSLDEKLFGDDFTAE